MLFVIVVGGTENSNCESSSVSSSCGSNGDAGS